MIPPIRHLAAICLLCVVLPAAAGAETLHADFADGECFVRTESGWLPLSSGDLVAEDAVIRMGPGALLEIGGESIRLSIAKEGIYDLARTVGEARERRPWNPGRILASIALKNEAGFGHRVETVMGVRAKQQNFPTEGLLEWVDEEDPAQLVRDGAAALEAGRIDEAVSRFDDAVSAVDPDPIGTRITIAGHWIRAGMSALALRFLTPAEADGFHPRFGEISLLKARLLLETGSFDEAVELLDRTIPLLESGSDAQAGWILLAIAHRGTGSVSDARQALEHARAVDPASELAKEAENLAGQL